MLRHTFVEFKDKEQRNIFVKNSRGMRIFLLITRTLILLFLLMALATPHTEKQITTQGSPSLTILVDNSTSFDMFDKTVAQDLVVKLKDKIPGDPYSPAKVLLLVKGIQSCLLLQSIYLITTDGREM